MKISPTIATLLVHLSNHQGGSLEVFTDERKHRLDITASIGFDEPEEAIAIEKMIERHVPQDFAISIRSEAMVLHVAISGEVQP